MTAPLVLSFDLDDTLWAVGPVIEAAEKDLHVWLREHHPHIMRGHGIESMRALRQDVAARFPERAHDMTFLRHRALRDMFAAAREVQAAAAAEVFADQALEVFFQGRNRVRLYDDVQPALERLRSRYRLYALSNGNADLARCGIAHLFDGHVTAIGAGAAKPDPRIFARLLEETGVDAAQVLHIGDDPHADVVGATRAGMQAAWINREARDWPAQFTAPTRTISTLAEII